MNKISIITVTYNCLEAFKTTFQDVLRQSYSNFEYIVIDGASTDGTSEFIKEHSSMIDYWVSESDGGIYDAMNKGIMAAKGDWALMLNAGDIFYDSNVLSNLFLNCNYDEDVIYGDYISNRLDGPCYVKCDRPFFVRKERFSGMGMGHQAIFVRVSWLKHFLFDTSFRCCADYNQMYSLYNSGCRFLYVGVPISVTEGRYGFSQNNRMLQFQEEARICKVDGTLWYKFRYLYVLTQNIYGRIMNYIRLRFQV